MRPKIQDQKLVAIEWKVVWSWVGMRPFLQKWSRTPNSYTTLCNLLHSVREFEKKTGKKMALS